MTRRRKERKEGRWLRRKHVGPLTVIANAVNHPKRQFKYRNEETGEERVVTQSLTHQGRVSARYQHITRTHAGTTRTHPLQTKQKRRAAAKQARRSRKANRTA